MFSAKQSEELSGSEQLCEAISELLWRDWKPVGVNSMLECRDEYYAYEDGVYLFAKYEPSKLSECLQSIQREKLGLAKVEMKISESKLPVKYTLNTTPFSRTRG